MNSLTARWAALRRSLSDELTESVRALVWWLLAAGAFFFVTGIILDLAGATRDYPFAVSMLSSGTAACFGIPVALVAIRHLQRSQEALARRVEVAGMAVSAADWILTSMAKYVVDGDRLEKGRSSLESIIGRISASRNFEKNTWEPVWYGAEDLREASEELTKATGNIYLAILKDDARSELRITLNKRWSYLCEHLRPRLYETQPIWSSSDGETLYLVRFRDMLASPDQQFPDPFSSLNLINTLGVYTVPFELRTLVMVGRRFGGIVDFSGFLVVADF